MSKTRRYKIFFFILPLSLDSYMPMQNVSCFYGEDLVGYLNLCLNHLYLCTLRYVQINRLFTNISV